MRAHLDHFLLSQPDCRAMLPARIVNLYPKRAGALEAHQGLDCALTKERARYLVEVAVVILSNVKHLYDDKPNEHPIKKAATSLAILLLGEVFRKPYQPKGKRRNVKALQHSVRDDFFRRIKGGLGQEDASELIKVLESITQNRNQGKHEVDCAGHVGGRYFVIDEIHVGYIDSVLRQVQSLVDCFPPAKSASEEVRRASVPSLGLGEARDPVSPQSSGSDKSSPKSSELSPTQPIIMVGAGDVPHSSGEALVLAAQQAAAAQKKQKLSASAVAFQPTGVTLDVDAPAFTPGWRG